MFKKFLSGIMAVAVCVVGLSGCGESPPEETETTVETTTLETTAKYSEEELEQMAQNMPEIVFVISKQMRNENIYGLYITNTGKVKIYDFRKIAPDEEYAIPDVYHRLLEATCPNDDVPREYKLYETDKTLEIDSNTILDFYKVLIQINGNIEEQIYTGDVDIPDDSTIVRYYGIRRNENNEQESVVLYGYGPTFSEFINNDSRAYELKCTFDYELENIKNKLR